MTWGAARIRETVAQAIEPGFCVGRADRTGGKLTFRTRADRKSVV